MYELYKIKENLYQIHCKDARLQAMEGSLLAIGTYMVNTLGFSPLELEAALLAMLERDMDAAHFGINRTFMWPFNKADRKVG